MHRLALAQLSVRGLTPPAIVNLAARLGCEGVTLNPGIPADDQANLPVDEQRARGLFRLDTDVALRRETAKALATTGVRVEFVDALVLTPNFSVLGIEPTIDAFQELGARLFNVVTKEWNKARYQDNLQALCELADARGIIVAVEFYKLSTALVPTLKDAVALATSGRYSGLKIVVDSLHLIRAGETPADLAAIDPSLIAAAQIADGRLAWPGQDAYAYEAVFERAIPGEGEFPLREFLQAIPNDVVLSPEVPLKSLRDRGISIEECARLGVEATRRLEQSVS